MAKGKKPSKEVKKDVEADVSLEESKKPVEAKKGPDLKKLHAKELPRDKKIHNGLFQIEAFILDSYPDHKIDTGEALDPDFLYLLPLKIFDQANNSPVRDIKKENILKAQKLGLYKFHSSLRSDLLEHSMLHSGPSKNFNVSAFKANERGSNWVLLSGKEIKRRLSLKSNTVLGG